MTSEEEAYLRIARTAVNQVKATSWLVTLQSGKQVVVDTDAVLIWLSERLEEESNDQR